MCGINEVRDSDTFPYSMHAMVCHPTTTELIPLSLNTFPSVPPPEGFMIGSSPRVDNADITLDVAGSSEVRV
ncbi:MAG: hypothetical protein CM1200mP3_04260 [Chloroflexota bacterium]|nr:MAG: hypothetical protein CM1200mP3_04260 [Chloroflexota bacterium]